MKKIFVALSMVAFLASCDDSSSASAENNEPTTLSSAEEQGSSSSTKKSTDSSDSRCEECNDNAISSSGNAESNGFSGSNGAGEDESSSSSEKKTAWDYLNPDIDYSEFVDKRDGQVYKAVKIGEQVWMAQNLNYAIAKGSYCYDKSDDNCATYGRLYEWAYAMDRTMVGCGYGYNCDLGTGNVQGVCPDGWHVPTKSEWEKLFAAVGGQSTAGTKLKATTLWEAEEGFANEDAYGFSALSAGFMGPIGTFNGVGGYTAFFWSATQYDNNHAYNMYLSYDYGGAYQDYYSKSNSFSVRCVKD